MGSSIIEPVISKDVLQMEQVSKPVLLRSLFTLGAMYSAHELSYTKILTIASTFHVKKCILCNFLGVKRCIKWLFFH